jgi:TPP-dependent pyruvate/acetoin dehydrogenase alpha subunit
MDKQDLIDFEKDIYDTYERGEILNSIHLSGEGNEEELINLFKNVREEDWVISTHRNHYHVLLKSNDKEWTKRMIKRSSMHIDSKKFKILTSSIVGGNLPIAVGVAIGNKILKNNQRVYCFTGDMASHMGIFHECYQYACGFDLPILFVVEDNKLGVNTPTEKVWGKISENNN